MEVDVAGEHVLVQVALGPAVVEAEGGGGGQLTLEGGVVELVAGEHGAGRAEPGVAGQRRLPVAEAGEPLLHPRPAGKDADHGVFPPLQVDESAGQVHEAAALGQHRPAAVGKGADGGAQAGVGGEAFAVQFRVAAAQVEPAEIRRQVVVGQRAEEHQLRPGRTEQVEVVLVVEAEGRVPGHADTHRSVFGCGHGGEGVGHRLPVRGQGEQPVQVEVVLGQPGQLLQAAWAERLLLAHVQPEVARGDGHLGPARHQAQHLGPAVAADGCGHHLAVTFGADAVGHHRSYAHLRVEGIEALDHRGHALRGRAHVHHQHHRQAQGFRQAGGRAQVAVEQPHHPLDHAAAVRRRVAGKGAADERRAAHAHVQVARHPAGDQPVQARVDEVRAALEGLHPHPAPGERGHHRQGDGGLAAARVGAGDEQSGLAHHRPVIPFWS